MNKTLEIELAEQGEAIAVAIEEAGAELLESAKEFGGDAYIVASRTIMICASIARSRDEH